MKKSKIDDQIKENDTISSKSKENLSYWEIADEKITRPSYPQLGTVSFVSFLRKIGFGLAFAFLPAIIFYLISGINFFYIWGVSILLVSGIYFIAGGWRDLSATSARKSHKKYMERATITKDFTDKFKFNLGLFQFGTFQEDIGAAICLLGIGAIILTFFS